MGEIKIVNYSVLIPTLNGLKYLKKNIEILKTINAKNHTEVIVIDSESTDGTVTFLEENNIRVIKALRRDFNHGSTRNMLANESKGSYLVFLTQDAILTSEDSIYKLVEPMENNKEIAVTYGRQLPIEGAKFPGAFARDFNYPNYSQVKSLDDKSKYGIKTVFCSNSYAAYRKTDFVNVGGFPHHVILAEDTYTTAKIVLSGKRVAYVADACVYHSHDYTIMQEFKRYFDIGVFYGRESWITENFNQAEGEGLKFLIANAKYIFKKGKYLYLLDLFLRNFAKLSAYRLGKMEQKIPQRIKFKISMHNYYWSKEGVDK
ncbi:glycosyltransferase [Bacillus sp. CBEL-1]|uniref:glycosyltransferase n=1 Tax=Bacillus sp. CBEL-1 TaxID=2502980 RepID=UPI0010434F15|nr:glycosyltransferase [Bacillus sp. CBEL-1]TDB55450.1 glycosyltransferase family 2 protein [Bacillus sp. CBEL-1]